MRIRHKVTAVLSEDAAGKYKLFAPDDALAEVVLDGMTEQSSGSTVVPALTTFAVPFAAITDARGLLLRGDGDFSLALNGGPALSVKRGVSGAGGAVAPSARVFLEAQLTSVEVTAGDTDLSLVYVLYGDPLT